MASSAAGSPTAASATSYSPGASMGRSKQPLCSTVSAAALVAPPATSGTSLCSTSSKQSTKLVEDAVLEAALLGGTVVPSSAAGVMQISPSQSVSPLCDDTVSRSALAWTPHVTLRPCQRWETSLWHVPGWPPTQANVPQTGSRGQVKSRGAKSARSVCEKRAACEFECHRQFTILVVARLIAPSVGAKALTTPHADAARGFFDT
eukprot:7378374-Prymnesium_polylepis.1